MQQLTEFLSDLNTFHQYLHFSHEFSTTSINFLDFTILKGPDFPFTNLLYSKTYQKPLNLYQYLHFTSSHPPRVFKSIIRGECVRYARTNTTPEGYFTTLHNFKQRLINRDYPIEKAINTVDYNNRQKYLNLQQVHQPTCSPPLFKSVSFPKYKLLKEIVLKNYNELRFVSPRFITLRHPTIGSTLIRAQFKPTDDQFVDISLALQNSTPTNHAEKVKLPNIHRKGPSTYP